MFIVTNEVTLLPIYFVIGILFIIIINSSAFTVQWWIEKKYSKKSKNLELVSTEVNEKQKPKTSLHFKENNSLLTTYYSPHRLSMSIPSRGSLVIQTKVREYVKGLGDLHVESDFLSALNGRTAILLREAAKRASAYRRRTVSARDI